MLPFYEGTAIHSKYNFNACSSSSSPYGLRVAGDDMVNFGLYNAKIEVLECPSHPQAGEISSGTGADAPGTMGFYSRRETRRTSYLFSSGIRTDYDAPYVNDNGARYQGAFGNDGAATFANITDGTSNAIAIGEAVGGRMKTSSSYGPWGLAGVHTCCHGRTWCSTSAGGGCEGSIPLRFIPAEARDWHINAAYNNDVMGRQYAWGWGSPHPGGAQFVLCDGSTRFLPETMDYVNLLRLAFIHDTEVATGF
jgi:hypothetical protein